MKCEEVKSFFAGPGARESPIPEAVFEHLLTCERCRAHTRINDLDWELSSGLHKRIMRNVADSLRPVQSLPARSSLVLRTVLVFVLLPLVTLGIIRPANPLLPVPQLAGVASVIAASEILLSLALVSLMVPGCRPRASPKLLIAGCILGNLAISLLLFSPGNTESFLEAGLPCLLTGCLVAVPAAVLLYLLANRGAVLAWGTTGAVIGLLAGLVGITALLVHCNIIDSTHLAVWHVGVLLICSVLGLSLGVLSKNIFRNQIRLPE